MYRVLKHHQRWTHYATRLGTAVAMTTLLLGAACTGDQQVAPGMGTLRLQLTDAPFPYDSVARADLFVVRIDGRVDAADSTESAADPDGSNNASDARRGWVTLARPNRSYDLFALRDGATVNLGETTLPTGTYRGFRLILDPAKSSITLKDGTVLTGSSMPGIKFPSAARTGVKIVLDAPITVVEGATIMVIDFDLGRSFVMRGNSIGQNGLLFKPVIRAAAHDAAGALRGLVRGDSATGAAVAAATIEVLAFGTPLTDTVSANVRATAMTDSTGAYIFPFLAPGIYAVRATPPSGSPYTAALLPSITVVTGDTAVATTFVLSRAP